MSKYSMLKSGNAVEKIVEYNVPGDFSAFCEFEIPKGTRKMEVTYGDCSFPASTDLNYFLSADGGSNWNIYLRTWYAEMDSGQASPSWSPVGQYVNSSPFNCGLLAKGVRSGTGNDKGASGQITFHNLHGGGIKSAEGYYLRLNNSSAHVSGYFNTRVYDLATDPAREINRIRIIATNGGTNAGSGFAFDKSTIQAYAYK